MLRVGLVGEDPSDTSAIKNLLQNRYEGRVHFLPLVKGIKGFQLDNPKLKRTFPIEIEAQKCKLVIFIRDLDALKSQTDKFRVKVQWFEELNNIIKSCGILLLNIWELEALILGDINTFNKVYHTNFKYSRDPMFVKEPKELLKGITSNTKKQYKESHCPDLFKELNIDTIESKCAFFREFLIEFDTKIK